MTKEVPPAPRTLRPRLAAYIGATILVGAAGITLSLIGFQSRIDVLALVVLCVMGFVSQALREPNVGSRVSFSFLSIILLASIPVVGPVGAATVGGLAMALETQRVPGIVRLFNFAMNVVIGVVGGITYLLLGGAPDVSTISGTSALVLHVALPLLAADALEMVTNAGLLAGIMRVDRGIPFRVSFVQMVSNSGVAYLGYGVIGFLFVVLWVPADVGPFSAVLILAPLFVARWAFVQYGDELRAHDSALSALVTAVETKDPYAAGHSARIADLVDRFVDPLSLSSSEVGALRFAAMLHDVGKVGIPTRIVQRPGEMTRDDLLVLASHPARGVGLLQGMTFLADSLEGIHHHHERWDGRGYPDGLAGDAIPLLSRIIAVADAFDSLTMPRPHRPAHTVEEAVAEITARASTQFDPRVVEALARALERHPWAPGVVDDDTLAAMTGYFDHDDPLSSDLYAAVVVDGRAWPEGDTADGLEQTAHPREPSADAAPSTDAVPAAGIRPDLPSAPPGSGDLLERPRAASDDEIVRADPTPAGERR